MKDLRKFPRNPVVCGWFAMDLELSAHSAEVAWRDLGRYTKPQTPTDHSMLRSLNFPSVQSLLEK